MLGRDPSALPITGRGKILSVEDKSTNLQGGGKVSGVCFKEGHKVPDPSWVLYTDGTSLIKQGQRLSG